MKMAIKFLAIFILLLFVASLNQFAKVVTKTSPSSQTQHKTKEQVIVKEVIDGDTFIATGNKKIRLIGIDAPEMNYKKGIPECGALRAKLFLKELIENKKVTLVKDKSETDKYNRLLRYVYLDNIFVNAELVKNGWAEAKKYYPDVRFQKELKDAQALATKSKIGIWSNLCKENKDVE